MTYNYSPVLRNLILLVAFASALAGPLAAQTATPYAIHTIAGSGSLGDGGPATAALLEFPYSVVVDPTGNLYIGDYGDGLIRMVDTAGTITSLAYGVAVSMKTDAKGAIYASDGLFRIYRIQPNGNIEIFAGSKLGYGGDGGAATAAQFSLPGGVAVDGQGNVYVADTYNQRVRKITSDGKIQTIAGNGIAAFGKENVTAADSPLAYPNAVEVDSAGNIYIAEEFRIRKINTSGVITTIAGNGFSPGDGLAINTAIGLTVALAMDKADNLYLADSDFNLVRMISPQGRVTTLAGSQTPGFAGDGTYTSMINGPMGLAVDTKGNVYIADTINQRIRKLNPAGLITTVAGTSHYVGDGGPATSALLLRPEQAIHDSDGNLIVSDTYNNVLRKVDSKGVITTIAGNGTCNYSGDLGKASAATFCLPRGIVYDSTGNLFVADWGNCVVRKIDTKGIITTVVGNGKCASTTSTSTGSLSGPWGLVFDSRGTLFISDGDLNRIYSSSLSGAPGTFAVVAGTGESGYSGDGGLSSGARLKTPTLLTIGPDGNLYFSDSGNDKVRKIQMNQGIPGIISTVTIPAVQGIALTSPDGIVFDAAGNMFVAWENSDVITRTTPTGATTIIAGTGGTGFSGDDGLAPMAEFSSPAGLSIDSAGNLFATDLFNNRVRELIPNVLKGISIGGGDGQSGNTGTTLPAPIVVTLNFQGGVGIAGIPVTFAVTSGSATLSTQNTTTDGNGSAGVAVTLGNVAGPVVITATTPGFSAVTFHLTAISAVPLPTISAGAIIGAGGSTPPVTMLSPNGFASVFGTNFAPIGTFAQAPGPSWPTNLANVCVTVNTLPSYITFVSDTQINFQVDNIPVDASVKVQVISNCGTTNELKSAQVTISTAIATPEFLYWVKNANGKNPVVAVNVLTGAYTGATGLIAGVPFVPAKPGDYLTIYGVSFGPTNPSAVPGKPSVDAAKSIYTPGVKLGAIDLDPNQILYAGVSPGTPGLYQLNIQIPKPLADGDYPIVLTLGGFSTPTGGFVTVKN